MRSLSGSNYPLLGRFVVVGIVNTAFSYGAYCFFLFLGAPYAIASLFALVLGIIWSFVTSGRLVFRQSLHGRFWRYVVVWALIYFVYIALIWVCTQFGLNAYLGGALAIMVTAPTAFMLQKALVFAEFRETRTV